MSNLTITLDEHLLRQARIRALEQGTSVNAVLREFLVAYVGGNDDCVRAVEDVIALAKRAASGRGTARWTRDDLHE